eukprot:3501028-Rhodomonas_salina.3
MAFYLQLLLPFIFGIMVRAVSVYARATRCLVPGADAASGARGTCYVYPVLTCHGMRGTGCTRR